MNAVRKKNNKDDAHLRLQNNNIGDIRISLLPVLKQCFSFFLFQISQLQTNGK